MWRWSRARERCRWREFCNNTSGGGLCWRVWPRSCWKHCGRQREGSTHELAAAPDRNEPETDGVALALVATDSTYVHAGGVRVLCVRRHSFMRAGRVDAAVIIPHHTGGL